MAKGERLGEMATRALLVLARCWENRRPRMRRRPARGRIATLAGSLAQYWSGMGSFGCKMRKRARVGAGPEGTQEMFFRARALRLRRKTGREVAQLDSAMAQRCNE